MNRILVYTAIFGNYDWLKDPVVCPSHVDFVCYTDSPQVHSDIWQIRLLSLDGTSPSLLNREVKILYPYTEFHDYDYSLYVDGSVMIKGDVNEFIQKYLPMEGIPMMNFKHPNNDCIFEEIKRCIQSGSGDADKLLEQYVVYKNDGMPVHAGLSDNKIILRNHHCAFGKILMDEWFFHVMNYSGRDQVCLSYVLYKNHIDYSYFEERIDGNAYFDVWPHNHVVWYIRWWRRLKWWLERHHLFLGAISYFDRCIKPKLLKRI